MIITFLVSYLARTPSHEQVEGDGKALGLRVIIQWPSKEATIAFMDDEEYATHLKAGTEAQ